MKLPLLDWQRPNSTEEYSYKLACDLNCFNKSHLFLFPWATAFDYSSKHSIPLETILSSVNKTHDIFCATVCQHIDALKYIDFMAKLGITDLFWSHATTDLIQSSPVRIHPYPLYPVQANLSLTPDNYEHQLRRDTLYCFHGAYDPHTYLSPARLWISDLIKDPLASIAIRKEWHFHQAIYREQIGLEDPDTRVSARLVEEKNEYIHALKTSVFSLCPSGTGPNSIRIWESLYFGAIPVIISDRLLLPGSQDLWNQCSLRISENQDSINNLPLLLRDLSRDQDLIRAMRAAGQIMWKHYGKPGFINDIISFLENPASFTLHYNKRKISILHGQRKQLIVTVSVPDSLGKYAAIFSKKPKLKCDIIVHILDTCFGSHSIQDWLEAIEYLKESAIRCQVFVSSVSPVLELLSSDPRINSQ